MKVKEQMKIRFDFLYTGVSTFANPCKPNTQTKVCKRASTSPTREKLFFKISFPSKIFKTATAQPTHKDRNTNLTMTAKPLPDLTFTTRQTERQLVTRVAVAQLSFFRAYFSYIL